MEPVDAVASITVSPARSGDLGQCPARATAPRTRLAHLARVIQVVVGTLFVILGLVALGVARFGSVEAAAAYLGGDRLLLSPSRASFGDARVGETREVTFSVENLTHAPVKILGATFGCTCMRTRGLPLEIPLRATGEFVLEVRIIRTLTGTKQKVKFFTDCPDKPLITVAVTGRVFQ